MKSRLQITRLPYEEPHTLNLVVVANNEQTMGAIEIYANGTDLEEAASALIGFPKHQGDEFLWELGSEAPAERFAFYFRVRVTQVSLRGACAIEFRFCNNEPFPAREITEFSIQGAPADIDRLGRLFLRFALQEHNVLEWKVESGELR